MNSEITCKVDVATALIKLGPKKLCPSDIHISSKNPVPNPAKTMSTTVRFELTREIPSAVTDRVGSFETDAITTRPSCPYFVRNFSKFRIIAAPAG